MITNPTHWREQRGSAPYEITETPLAAGAAHILTAAADQAWQDARTETQVIQIQYRPDAAIGQTLVASIDDGRTLSGKISGVEHIIDPPQAITRLEIEVER